ATVCNSSSSELVCGWPQGVPGFGVHAQWVEFPCPGPAGCVAISDGGLNQRNAACDFHNSVVTAYCPFWDLTNQETYCTPRDPRVVGSADYSITCAGVGDSAQWRETPCPKCERGTPPAGDLCY